MNLLKKFSKKTKKVIVILEIGITFAPANKDI